MSRRRRRSSGGTLLAHAAVAALVWALVARVFHAPSPAAPIAAGAAWGLLAGWHWRGRFERWLRRLIRRLLFRGGGIYIGGRWW